MKKKIFVLVLFVFGCLSNPINAQWITVCNTGNGFVDDLDTFQNSLWCTGFYTNLCGQSSNYVSSYDGTNWLAAGNGLFHSGHHLENINQT